MGEGIFREGGIWGRENLGEVDSMEAKEKCIYTNIIYILNIIYMAQRISYMEQRIYVGRQHVIYGETTLYMKTTLINWETTCYIYGTTWIGQHNME